MRETSKANSRRAREPIFREAIRGRVIDIGAGNDPLRRQPYWPNIESIEAFDRDHGDANFIDELRRHGDYDLVFASHCLEHMHDPLDAIRRWLKLVKIGGHLLFAVPHENLYEQGVWPSRWNPDHKASWRISSEPSWCRVSISLTLSLPLVLGSAGEVRLCKVYDTNYDYQLLGSGVDQTLGSAEAQIDVIIRRTG